MWPDVSSLVTTVRPLTLTAFSTALCSTNDNEAILDYYLIRASDITGMA